MKILIYLYKDVFIFFSNVNIHVHFLHVCYKVKKKLEEIQMAIRANIYIWIVFFETFVKVLK